MEAFWRGEMTLRRLWVLVSRVPQESNTARILHGEAADWHVGDYIAARIANILLQANASKRVPDSQLINPPGSTAAQVKAKAGGNRKTGGAKELDALFTGGDG